MSFLDFILKHRMEVTTLTLEHLRLVAWSMALSLLAGSAMLLTTGTLAGEAKDLSIANITTKSWLAFAYLIVFGSIIAFTAYNWLLEHFSPTLVATHTYVNPVVAVLLGWLYGGETITLKVGIAAALVVGAVFLVDRGTNKLNRLA